MTLEIDVDSYLRERIASPKFQEFLGSALMDICEVDTTPSASIECCRRQEHEVFDIITKLVEKTGLPGSIVYYDIDHHMIENHPSYTPLHYTNAKAPYKERSNLVYHLGPFKKSAKGDPLAFNAHIDTIAPHIPPTRDGSIITGRGSCDDKGNAVIMIGVLKLLGEIHERFGVYPNNEITCMFVIDEESGGNGSLALALDGELTQHYNSLIVLECCGSQAYPANRGALWYKIELPLERLPAPMKIAADLILALEKEGRKIKAESTHELFPDCPVQTCHGIFGPWGEHPSRICGYVELNISSTFKLKEIEQVILESISTYTAEYGDKTISTDGTKTIVPWHFRIKDLGKKMRLEVMGSTGHMAAIDQNDGALTKAAYIISALYAYDPAINISLVDQQDYTLIMEGGQSFLPTHTIQDIKKRITNTCAVVLEEFGISRIELGNIVTMNKLHNSAFCSDAHSTLFKKNRYYLNDFGVRQAEPVRGWGASCDARLFWEARPDIPIVTTGVGTLDDAHSDTEKVDLNDICIFSGVLALLALDYTGSFS